MNWLPELPERLDAAAREATAGVRLRSPADVAAAGRRRGRRRHRQAGAAVALATLVVVALIALGASVGRGGHHEQVTSGGPGAPTTAAGVPMEALGPLARVVADEVGVVRGTVIGDARVVATTYQLGSSGRPIPAYLVAMDGSFPCPFGCTTGAGTLGHAVVLVDGVTMTPVEIAFPATATDLSGHGPVTLLPMPSAGSEVGLPGLIPASDQPTGEQVEVAALGASGCPYPVQPTGTTDVLPVAAIPLGAHCTSVTVRRYPDFAALAAAQAGVVEPGLYVAHPGARSGTRPSTATSRSSGTASAPACGSSTTTTASTTPPPARSRAGGPPAPPSHSSRLSLTVVRLDHDVEITNPTDRARSIS